jgi:hypothetical protein
MLIVSRCRDTFTHRINLCFDMNSTRNMNMKHYINNFVGDSPIVIEAADYSDTKSIGNKLVLITQRANAMSFQHGMTIEQAKQLSEALLACCKELES